MTAPDVRSLVLVLAASTVAAIVYRLHRRILLPTVVLEIILGIIMGPEVLDIADTDPYIEFLATIGLVFLFFAGLEVIFVATGIDFDIDSLLSPHGLALAALF